MTKNKEIAFELWTDLEVTASITPFYKGDMTNDYYGPMPDEPSEVEDLVVHVNVYGERLNITDLLTVKMKKQIERKCFEFLVDEGPDDDDREG